MKQPKLWAIVMAGGSGQRLWPLSRKERPKQTLKLGYERSLLQVTVDRFKRMVPDERIVVVTTKDQERLVRKHLPQLPKANILVEPMARNTAAAIGLGTIYILKQDPDALIAVVPADQVIRPVQKFQKTIRAAAKLAYEKTGLVCLGVKPTYPATGFGYVEPDTRAKGPGGFRVKQFIEKPDRKSAERLLKNVNMAWNAGIFCWQGQVVLENMRHLLPGLFGGLMEIGKVLGTRTAKSQLSKLYAQLPSISVDVGVMERSRDVWMVPTEFDWDDVGSWNSLAFLHAANAQGNVVLGDHIGVETQGAIVVGSDKHLIATVGVQDLVIVHTEDATLVCHKNQSQEVKKIVAQIEQSKRLKKLL